MSSAVPEPRLSSPAKASMVRVVPLRFAADRLRPVNANSAVLPLSLTVNEVTVPPLMTLPPS